MNLFERIKEKFLPTGGGTLSGWNIPQNYFNKRQILQRYEGYVYACVRPIAQAVAKIDIKVVRYNDAGEERPILNHSFLNLFYNPNNEVTKTDFMQNLVTHKKVAGEAFVYMLRGELTGRPKEFHLLRPDLMEVVVGRDDNGLPQVRGYVYTQEETGKRVPLEADDILHIKEPNPLNPFRGLSAVEAGILYVMTERYGAEFTRNFIANNATPSGVLNIKGTIDDPTFEKLKRKFNAEYSGQKNAGKTFFLRNSQAEYIKMGSNLSEINLSELKNMSRDDIMMMFGVTKPILGILDDVNLASAKASHYIFAKQIVDPEMGILADAFTRIVHKWWSLEDDVIHISAVPEDEEAKFKFYNESTFLSINEKRQAYGEPEIQGGDGIYMPFNMVLVGDAGSKKKAIITERSFITVKRKGLADTTPQVVEEVKKKEVEVSEQALWQTKENFRLTVEKVIENYTRLFQNKMNEVIEDQERDVLELLPGLFGKATNTSEVIDIGLYNAELEAVLTSVLYELAKEQGNVALIMAGADALDFELREAIKRQLDESIARMAVNYNQETLDQVKAAIADAMAGGSSRVEAQKKIREVFKDAKGYRSERAARTEVRKSSNIATNEAYRQTGYVTHKEWFTNPGACEFCRYMAKDIVSLDDSFADQGTSIVGDEGGTYKLDYESVNSPPLHPNCTCTILPVIK